MNIAKIWKDSKSINSATGLTLEEATSLLKKLEDRLKVLVKKMEDDLKALILGIFL